MKISQKEVTVFRFPQHSADINTLPPEEKAKMDSLATEIADSFVLGKAPIIAFVIIGHADRDPNGADFEMQVSVNRAEAAQEWLVQQAKAQVQQQGGDPTEVDSAEFSLFSQGASNLFTEDVTFPEREKNRRVVVKYAAVELDLLQDALGYGPNLARALALIQVQPSNDQIARVKCVLEKLLNPTVDDTYFEWGTLSQVAGGLRGLSDDQILAIARSIIGSLRRDIANNNNYGLGFAPDDVVVANLLQWESTVRFTKNKLVEQIALDGAAAGQVHKSVARYIARNETNPNSILSCFIGT